MKKHGQYAMVKLLQDPVFGQVLSRFSGNPRVLQQRWAKLLSQKKKLEKSGKTEVEISSTLMNSDSEDEDEEEDGMFFFCK